MTLATITPSAGRSSRAFATPRTFVSAWAYSVLRIADPQRRDRLLLLNAFAIVLLTLLGAAGVSLGMDRHLKVNTAKHRTHSLFRQGCMLYELIPNMPEVRLRPLVERFSEYITQNRALAQTFSVV